MFSVRTYVLSFQNQAEQNKFHQNGVPMKTVIATGGTVGLAKGIIDETNVLYYIVQISILNAIK